MLEIRGPAQRRHFIELEWRLLRFQNQAADETNVNFKLSYRDVFGCGGSTQIR